jgi:DNA-binding IclR family transcriptional regulator
MVAMARSAISGVPPTNPVGSVDNALRLLLLFRNGASLSVSQASVELGVAKSTAHRLLAMLLAYELLQQDPQTRAYRAGPMLAELGRSALDGDDLVSVVHPFLERLTVAVEETTHAIVLEGRNCRFIDSVECHQALRTTERVGVVYPAHVTSGGKALLAELDAARLAELFADDHLPPLNERSHTTRSGLFAELEQIRRLGYATNFGESEMGIAAVAMAQRSRSGAAPVAIAISAPEQRLPDSRVPEFVDALRAVTHELHRRLL